jgi:hypothetical protein
MRPALPRPGQGRAHPRAASRREGQPALPTLQTAVGPEEEKIMVFIDIVDEQGNKTGWAHLNTGRRHVELCKFCLKLDGLRQLAGRLCDYPIGKGRTCNAPICQKHSTPGGKGIDYCPDHKNATGTQPRLFEEPEQVCGTCNGTGEVCYSSTSYGPCFACGGGL